MKREITDWNEAVEYCKKELGVELDGAEVRECAKTTLLGSIIAKSMKELSDRH